MSHQVSPISTNHQAHKQHDTFRHLPNVFMHLDTTLYACGTDHLKVVTLDTYVS